MKRREDKVEGGIGTQLNPVSVKNENHENFLDNERRKRRASHFSAPEMTLEMMMMLINRKVKTT